MESLKLINKLKKHLQDMEVEWHLCGGYAIYLFLGKETRDHKDLDITVSFHDMKLCIDYLKSKGWKIVAPVGSGRFVSIEVALENPKFYFDNIWCFHTGADFIKVTAKDEEFEYLEMKDRVQEELDFIEVLFNQVDDQNMYYLKNRKITRDKMDAFKSVEGISILAPEIILLYKTRNTENVNYQNDFMHTVNQLSRDQKCWLKSAMIHEYPDGHPWGFPETI